MTLADDTIVGTVGTDMDRRCATALIASRVRSDRYGIVVTAAMARNGVFATYDDLRRIGMVVTGLLALIILAARADRAVAASATTRSTRSSARIGAGEFVPYYQPIVDITSGKLLGAEVLVRWRKRDGTLVPPGAFIPLLESTGLILDMTRSLMRQVCEEVGAVHRAARRTCMSAFNIAPRHLTDDMLLNDVGSIFEGVADPHCRRSCWK